MWTAERLVRRALTVPLAALMAGSLLVACDDDDPTTEPDPTAPNAVTVTATVQDLTLNISWTNSPDAASYRVEAEAGGSTVTKSANAGSLSVAMTEADGVADNSTYTVVVYAINTAGETESSNSPQVSTNLFPWDEYYETSLHVTGAGKPTFYNTVPNGGFEQFVGVPYNDLNCKSCHEPSLTGGCASCHESSSPGLGSEVDASLTGACGTCHGRQKAEAANYNDVHRDAGMGCMDCHTMEDVHGDGTEYASLIEPGAIDTECADCHSDVPDNTYHSIHTEGVDCSVCHTQSVITCYNCHFESEIEVPKKIAYGQFKDWIFLVNNAEGKVAVANMQSLKYGNATFAAMAPYYAHTIERAVYTCGDCHGNEAVDQWFAEGTIQVTEWDHAQDKFNYLKGVIPVPPNVWDGGFALDFADLDAPGGSVWSFLKSGADSIQILYGTPLTEAQMDKLK